MITIKSTVTHLRGSLDSKVKIHNGIVALMFSDKSISDRTYKWLKKKDPKVVLDGGVIIQHRQGKTDEEIRDEYVADLKKTQSMIGAGFQLKYWVTTS